jgi:predicted component of type VI protein secretion system
VAASAYPVQSAAELQARIAAQRSNHPFLLFRDERGGQQIHQLSPEVSAVAVGRTGQQDITLAWDPQVSRIHAVLERVGGHWTVVDDGLSRNGTYVNGSRLVGRRRLQDGDVLRCGSVILEFTDPAAATDDETLRAADGGAPAQGLSPAQRRVLLALCRPLANAPHGPPATNKQIAAELSLSVDAVKSHLRRVSEVLEVHDMPQNQKRAELAWKALSSGLVSTRELAGT